MWLNSSNKLEQGVTFISGKDRSIHKRATDIFWSDFPNKALNVGTDKQLFEP